MSTIDDIQFQEIANINTRLFALERQDVIHSTVLRAHQVNIDTLNQWADRFESETLAAIRTLVQRVSDIEAHLRGQAQIPWLTPPTTPPTASTFNPMWLAAGGLGLYLLTRRRRK